jgi:hypothetical protein
MINIRRNLMRFLASILLCCGSVFAFFEFADNAAQTHGERPFGGHFARIVLTEAEPVGIVPTAFYCKTGCIAAPDLEEHYSF